MSMWNIPLLGIGFDCDYTTNFFLIYNINLTTFQQYVGIHYTYKYNTISKYVNKHISIDLSEKNIDIY